MGKEHRLIMRDLYGDGIEEDGFFEICFTTKMAQVVLVLLFVLTTLIGANAELYSLSQNKATNLKSPLNQLQFLHLLLNQLQLLHPLLHPLYLLHQPLNQLQPLHLVLNQQ